MSRQPAGRPALPAPARWHPPGGGRRLAQEAAPAGGLGFAGGYETCPYTRHLAELEQTQPGRRRCAPSSAATAPPRATPAARCWFTPDGTFIGTVGGGEMENRVIAEARQAILDGQPAPFGIQHDRPGRGDPGVCGGQVEVFVEPLIPKPILVVIGAGHVGKAVVHLAHWLGFCVVVNDDRPDFCTPEAVPGADEYHARAPGRAARPAGDHPLDVSGAHHPRRECRYPWLARPAGYPGGLHRRDRLAAALGHHPQGSCSSKASPPKADRQGALAASAWS